MVKRCIICIIILVLQLTSVANAESRFASVFGMTDLSCGKYIQDVTTNPETSKVYDWWIAGFVTGTNLVKKRVTSTDNAAHEAWLKKYCQDHPLDPFMKAAAELNEALDK